MIRDFRYGLQQAIADNVCRSPRITLIDNLNLKVIETESQNRLVSTYRNIAHLLESSPIGFEDILRNDKIMTQVLCLGSQKLNSIRKTCPQAGGLIVATNVAHAKEIAAKMSSMGESFCIATTKTGQAQETINEFRNGNKRWIIAVGMISEGTDIPRLQVCCYLSRIRTELHYRQVLGRILRRIGLSDEQAWLYVMAESALIDFSKRVSDDLPDDRAVIDIRNLTELNVVELNSTGDAFAVETWPPDFEDMPRGENYQSEESISSRTSEPTYTLDISKEYRTELLAIS